MRIALHVNLCDAGMNAGGEVAAGEFPERDGSTKLGWLFSPTEFCYSGNLRKHGTL